ncbi:DVU_1555 family C-GCAxxG-C-C protein [Pelobacter propionicus]|nr:DV_1555 family C-GCAxxG-C-C protein [Pelobacter propionicus]
MMIDDTTFTLMELSQKGYFCSQILLILALRNQGKENPDLVRALYGISKGTAGQLGTCGTLTGAACLLSLYAGKGSDDEQESELLPGMLEELWEWFEHTYTPLYGGITCAAILADGTQPRERCGAIVANVYNKCLEILVANGFDPSEGPTV